MNTFWFLTTSNKPRLRDPTQVKRVIDKYWFDFDCEVTIARAPGGRSHLCIEGDGWPAAWLLPPGTSSEEYYPDYDTPGQEEFVDFLTEITPFLMETLVIQAVGTVNGQFPLLACEWRVDPVTATVAKSEFTSPSVTAETVYLASA